MATSGTHTKGNVDILDSLLFHSQEEADTLLILHAPNFPNDTELARYIRLVVASPHVSKLANIYNLLHKKGPDKEKHIGTGHISNKLGSKRASALLGFHPLAGSNMSGRFAGRTKDSCFKTFISCDDKILDALAMLGNDNDLTSDACSVGTLCVYIHKSK